MITIGITGIIGSGKSTVSAMLGQAGITVIDLDNLAKEVSAGPAAREGIRRTFGEGYLREDGTIDADRMKELVFRDKGRLRQLEAIMHPLIRAEMERRAIEEWERGARAVIIDGPLIFEKGMYKELDKVVVVSADAARIKERLIRRGMTAEDVERRMANQMPLAEKEKMADYVIYNNGTEDDLREKLKILLEKIKTWEVEDTCILTN